MPDQTPPNGAPPTIDKRTLGVTPRNERLEHFEDKH